MAAVLACEEENTSWNVNDQRVFGKFVEATKKFVQHAQHLVKFENFVFGERWLALREGGLGWKAVSPVRFHDGDDEFWRQPSQDAEEKYLQRFEFIRQSLHL